MATQILDSRFPGRRLTPKEIRFTQEYVKTGNASEAIRRAYPTSRSWTEASINVEASQALDKPKIAAEIARLMKKGEDQAISTVKERKELLSRVQRGELSLTALDLALKSIDHRLKAVDLHNRMENLYIDRTQSENLVRLEVVITKVGSKREVVDGRATSPRIPSLDAEES